MLRCKKRNSFQKVAKRKWYWGREEKFGKQRGDGKLLRQGRLNLYDEKKKIRGKGRTRGGRRNDERGKNRQERALEEVAEDDLV